MKQRIIKFLLKIPFTMNLYKYYLQRKAFTKFQNDFKSFKILMIKSERDDFNLLWENRYPILNENSSTIPFDAHYIYHTAWAARILQEYNVIQHVDISSSTYFASIVSAFLPVHFYDYRPIELKLNQLDTGIADLTKLQFESNSISSLSSMHVVEHIGLGRYGDSLDPRGDLKAINELWRVIRPTGLLLFVVPVGKPIICFNAHRIYDPLKIPSYFHDMELLEFSCVLDSGDFFRKVDLEKCKYQDYACGMYLFRKRIEN